MWSGREGQQDGEARLFGAWLAEVTHRFLLPHLQPNSLAWTVATFYIDRDGQKGKNQDTPDELSP